MNRRAKEFFRHENVGQNSNEHKGLNHGIRKCAESPGKNPGKVDKGDTVKEP